MNKLTRCLFLPFALVAAITGPAFSDVSLTFVIDKAIQRSPTLKGARAQIEGVQGSYREIRSLRYPRMSVRTIAARGDNPVYVFGSLLEQQSFGPSNFAIDSLNNPDKLTNIKNALDFGLPLFMGFEISNGEEVQQMMYERAKEQYAGADQEAHYQIVEEFLSALQKQERLQVLSERVASAQGEVEDARKLNAKGLVLGSDFYAAQALLSSLRARQSQAEKEFEASLDILAVLIEEPFTDKLSGRLSKPRYAVDEKMDFLTTALDSRRDLKEAKLQVSVSDLMRKQSRRSVLPRIEAFASLETNTEDFDSNPTNHTVGIRSNFPVGDPSYFARRSRAESEAHLAQSQQELIEDHIRMDVVRAVKAYQAAVASLPLIEKAVEESAKSLSMFRPLYKEGRQSILAVLRAEEGLATAQEALNDNEFQIHLGYARLHLATGQLGPVTIEAIQSNLERAR